MRQKYEITKEWANRDSITAACWTMSWIAGDVGSAQGHLKDAVQKRAINDTASADLNNFMHKSIFPLGDLPLIKDMGLADRLALVKRVVEKASKRRIQ